MRASSRLTTVPGTHCTGAKSALAALAMLTVAGGGAPGDWPVAAPATASANAPETRIVRSGFMACSLAGSGDLAQWLAFGRCAVLRSRALFDEAHQRRDQQRDEQQAHAHAADR